MTIAYQDASNWEERIRLMQEWRAIASRFSTPTFNVTIYEHNGIFVDQMLSLKDIAIQVFPPISTDSREYKRKYNFRQG
jgi:hypothetical protein